jgi:hypothetical protein
MVWPDPHTTPGKVGWHFICLPCYSLRFPTCYRLHVWASPGQEHLGALVCAEPHTILDKVSLMEGDELVTLNKSLSQPHQ